MRKVRKEILCDKGCGGFNSASLKIIIILELLNQAKFEKVSVKLNGCLSNQDEVNIYVWRFFATSVRV